jgi:hypothetical protein
MIEKTVTITHPDGAPMHFSESLSEFLLNRFNKTAPFFIGHWIESLSDKELNRLPVLAEEFVNGSESSNLDDILGVIFTAVVAETRINSVDVVPDKVNEWCVALLIVATMETYRRRGYIEILAALSIDPNAKATVRLTELGLKEAGNLTFH